MPGGFGSSFVRIPKGDNRVVQMTARSFRCSSPALVLMRRLAALGNIFPALHISHNVRGHKPGAVNYNQASRS
jgi:hypothetical protein